MAKKKAAAAEDGEETKKKKKPIVPIVLVLVGLFGAKTFLLKPAPKTAAALAAEQQQLANDLYNTCAAANNMPPLATGTNAPTSTTSTTPNAPTTSTTPTTTATTTKKGALAGTRPIEVQLIAALAEGAGSAVVPIVAGMGQVLALDSVTVNLTDSHYLKVGVALQLAEGVDVTVAKDSGLGAKALDMALGALAKHSMQQLISPTVRDTIKNQLGFDVCEAYDGKVLTVYFTEFVMQ